MSPGLTRSLSYGRTCLLGNPTLDPCVDLPVRSRRQDTHHLKNWPTIIKVIMIAAAVSLENVLWLPADLGVLEAEVDAEVVDAVDVFFLRTQTHVKPIHNRIHTSSLQC